jgi:hypothetical protein
MPATMELGCELGIRRETRGKLSLIVIRTSPFKVVKFRTKIGYFNLQKAENMSG